MIIMVTICIVLWNMRKNWVNDINNDGNKYAIKKPIRNDDNFNDNNYYNNDDNNNNNFFCSTNNDDNHNDNSNQTNCIIFYWCWWVRSVNSKNLYLELISFFSVRKKRNQIHIWSFYCLPNAPNNNDSNNSYLHTLISSVTESGVRATLFSPEIKNIKHYIRQYIL